jgi:hypothetical protein
MREASGKAETRRTEVKEVRRRTRSGAGEEETLAPASHWLVGALSHPYKLTIAWRVMSDAKYGRANFQLDLSRFIVIDLMSRPLPGTCKSLKQ